MKLIVNFDPDQGTNRILYDHQYQLYGSVVKAFEQYRPDLADMAHGRDDDNHYINEPIDPRDPSSSIRRAFIRPIICLSLRAAMMNC